MAKRSVEAILEDFRDLEAAWSPENLTCDGELSRSEVRAKESKLRATQKRLEAELGRKPTSAELYPELQPPKAQKLPEPVTVYPQHQESQIDVMVEDYWLKQSGGDLDMLAAEIIKTSISGIDESARLRNQEYVHGRMADYGIKKPDFYALARAVLKKRGKL